MSSYARMTKEELIERIHALESALARQDQRDETRHLLHQLEVQGRELRQTRQALEDSRNRYVELYDGAPVGCLTLTPQSRIVDLNLAAAALLGADRNHLLSLPLASRLSPGQSGVLFQHLGQIFANGAPCSIELVIESAGGQWSDVQLTSWATQDPDHGPVCRTVMIDVTERRRAAAVLQESQERLQQLAARLTDADRHKNEFLAMLGHELRNPLAAVRLVIDAFRLRQAEIPPPLRQGLKIAEGQMTLLCRLVDDLLDIARLSRGQIKFRKVQIDLAEAVTQAVQSQQALIESRRQQLSLSLPPQPLLLDADPNRLAQMIGNLLNNAARFTGEGGSIEMAVRREGAEAVIEVSDTGQGIAPGLLAQLFQPFIQAETSLNRPYGRLGLGLSLARQVAELHGGLVQSSSLLTFSGSTFN
ncbi:MAG: HAMP domain-containing histidine kinase, partial [Pseudomonadota bacterium]|nr:HAMP domain-containing histidine kinase [Pseudomonadota bacterium]